MVRNAMKNALPITSLLIILAIAPLASAAPRDELLRLVPDDMAICAILQDVREHFKSDNPLLTSLARMPIIKTQLNSPEFARFVEVQTKVLDELGLTKEQLVDDLIGDAFVFAFRPDPMGKQENEQALFMLWARDEKLLAKVIDRVNEIQKKSNELKELRALQHGKQSYIERSKAKDEKEYYLVSEHVLIFSPREAAIKGAIDRMTAPRDGNAKPFWSSMLERLGVDKATAALMVNPRAFDRELARQKEGIPASEKAFISEFQKYWKAADGLAFSIHAKPDLELGLSIGIKQADLPEAAQKFFGDLSQPSALWKTIPEDALFAISARTNISAFAETLLGFVEESKRKEMLDSISAGLGPFLPEKATLDSLAKGLGPDWGMWIEAPKPNARSWVPQAVLAIKKQDTDDGKTSEETIRSGIQFLSTISRLASKNAPKLESTTIDQLEIKYLTHDSFPIGFRPAFAVKDGFIVFASSVESIQRFSIPKVAPAMNETPLLRISAAGWSKYLSAHKLDLASAVAKLNGSSAKDVAAQIDELLPNLKELDRLELSVRGQKDLATIVLRLKTAKK